MVYRLLADLVVLIHLLFVAFALFGGALALRWTWMPWVHLPAAAWGAMLEFCGWLCPLTPLENLLRRAGGGAGYSGGFVERYIVPLVYPTDLTRELQLVLGCIVVGVNAGVYSYLWCRFRRLRGSSHGRLGV